MVARTPAKPGRADDDQPSILCCAGPTGPARTGSGTVSFTFRVDLRGIVDLLSHHLYASPRVYVREVLQNAVDAITAARQDEPGAAGRVGIESSDATGDGSLRIADDGIGLTEAQVHELLAT